MKYITIVKKFEVNLQPFVLNDFSIKKEKNSTMKKMTKKTLKALANDLGLDYDEANLNFAKKLFNAQIKKNI